MLDFGFNFIGVFLTVLGVMIYTSGIVRAAIIKKSFSGSDAGIAVVLISLGMAILLTI